MHLKNNYFILNYLGWMGSWRGQACSGGARAAGSVQRRGARSRQRAALGAPRQRAALGARAALPGRCLRARPAPGASRCARARSEGRQALGVGRARCPLRLVLPPLVLETPVNRSMFHFLRTNLFFYGLFSYVNSLGCLRI